MLNYCLLPEKYPVITLLVVSISTSPHPSSHFSFAFLIGGGFFHLKERFCVWQTRSFRRAEFCLKELAQLFRIETTSVCFHLLPQKCAQYFLDVAFFKQS